MIYKHVGFRNGVPWAEWCSINEDASLSDPYPEWEMEYQTVEADEDTLRWYRGSIRDGKTILSIADADKALVTEQKSWIRRILGL